MILTLILTLIVESAIVIAYSFGKKKPLKPLLFTSICGNLITQSLLWIVLNLFFRSYLVTLSIAEILIWGIESLMLYSVRANQLDLKEAILLSMGMNALSLALGWFLPI